MWACSDLVDVDSAERALILLQGHDEGKNIDGSREHDEQSCRLW
jgi:hypothetical protein